MALKGRDVWNSVSTQMTRLIFKEHEGTKKRELKISNLKWFGIFGIVLFITIALLLPQENETQFSQKAELTKSNSVTARDEDNRQETKASSLWEAPKMNYARSGGPQVNHNTSMIIGPKGGNAKTQLRAGSRLPIRILDKFTVSQEQVPILAELIMDSTTDSGLRLPAGTRFYGEASFQKGMDRASILFKQISLPSGQIRAVSGMASGKDGQTGIPGHVFSDGLKNTAGQLLTTFVGSLAAGSMETDIFGHSRGGVGNGLLNAVSQTAQTRTQMYGEKLKTEREWIEVPAGQEADAILNESINLQDGGDQ